jgi:hypothetical protein
MRSSAARDRRASAARPRCPRPAADHAGRAHRLGRDLDRARAHRRRRAVRLAREDEQRVIEQRIAGEDRERLVELLVHRRPPAAQIVVVERR